MSKEELNEHLQTVKRVCTEIMDALPKKRDWLDPVLEQEIQDLAQKEIHV